MNSSSTNNNKSDTNSTWGLDTTSLDEWLENDLKQSSLFHKRAIKTTDKCSLNHIISKEEPISIKQEKPEAEKAIPTHLIPLIKVYSLLHTIKQKEMMTKEPVYTTPPSPILSVHSNENQKKRRGNQRTPVDVITKRQRNTDAARRSRLRKANKMETLEHKVEVLQKDNHRLRVKVAVLENDICHATEKDQRNRLRVLELEAQLALAHKQLVQEYENDK